MRFVPLIALALAATGCSGCEKKTPAPQQAAPAASSSPATAEPATKPAEPAVEPAAAATAAAAVAQSAEQKTTEEKMREAAQTNIAGKTSSFDRASRGIDKGKLKHPPKRLKLAPKLFRHSGGTKPAPAAAPAVAPSPKE